MTDKAQQFIATRIGQDALTIADLLQQLEVRDARIAELEERLAACLAEHGGPPAD